MIEKRSLAERLDGGGVVCAEGYLFELERRGYLQAGSFVPEVSLDHPEALARLHEDFLFCGSDVAVAFTYNGHREKMRIIGKEDLLEPLNRRALAIAREAAAAHEPEPALFAGNISNTNVFDPADPASADQARAMFREMAGWAADEGADYVIAETFYYHGEAMLALEEIKRVGLPAVVTLGLMAQGVLRDGVDVAESCARLEQAGALVTGMNCFRGPATMLGHLRKVREAVSGHVAALPVPYRTTEEHPTFFNLPDTACPCCASQRTSFPTGLDPFYVSRCELREFAVQAIEADIRYLGVCCGGAPMHVREIAEAMGRTPPASRYSPDMSRHFLFGSEGSLKRHNLDYAHKA